MKLVAPMSSLVTMDDVYKADGFAMVMMIVEMEGKKIRRRRLVENSLKMK